MKKLLAVLVAVVVLMSTAVTAFAEPELGAFVQSPSNNLAPVIEGFEVESDDCEAVLAVTPYAERDDLSAEVKEELEAAYAEIRGTEDLTTLSEALAEVAEEKKIESKALAVSDLFDLQYTKCTPAKHAEGQHGTFKIRLKAETLENFVGLLHYTDEGWELVETAEVIEEDILGFSCEEFSPFAIVVSTELPAVVEPEAANYNWLWIVLAVVAVIAFIIILAKRRKKDEEEA